MTEESQKSPSVLRVSPSDSLEAAFAQIGDGTLVLEPGVYRLERGFDIPGSPTICGADGEPGSVEILFGVVGPLKILGSPRFRGILFRYVETSVPTGFGNGLVILAILRDRGIMGPEDDEYEWTPDDFEARLGWKSSTPRSEEERIRFELIDAGVGFRRSGVRVQKFGVGTGGVWIEGEAARPSFERCRVEECAVAVVDGAGGEFVDCVIQRKETRMGGVPLIVEGECAPIFKNCVVRGNAEVKGGATAEFVDCEFFAKRASCVHFGDVDALIERQKTASTFRNCRFSGGVGVGFGAESEFVDCEIVGVDPLYSPVEVFHSYTSPTFKNCSIRAESGERGRFAVLAYDRARGEFVDCEIVGGSADGDRNAIHLTNVGTRPTFKNCSIRGKIKTDVNARGQFVDCDIQSEETTVVVSGKKASPTFENCAIRTKRKGPTVCVERDAGSESGAKLKPTFANCAIRAEKDGPAVRVEPNAVAAFVGNELESSDGRIWEIAAENAEKIARTGNRPSDE